MDTIDDAALSNLFRFTTVAPMESVLSGREQRTSGGTESNVTQDNMAVSGSSGNAPAAAPNEGSLKLNLPKRRPNVVKAGRNEPCPCGSGKKFKQCCGRMSD
jgi:preprotein translocase subunit SecA